MNERDGGRAKPHRFGRHTRIEGEPREIGEPSPRVRERAARKAQREALDEGHGELPLAPRDAPEKPLAPGDAPERLPLVPHDAPGQFPSVHRDAPEQLPLLHRSARKPAQPPQHGHRTPESARARESFSYAELHCLSNFSFQRGASHAEELFERAKKLGYRALAITDECTLAGIVRAFEAAKDTGVALIVGSEFVLADGPKLVVLAADHAGYSDLCRLITLARRRSAKGEYRLGRADVAELGSGVRVLWTPGPVARRDAASLDDDAMWIMQHFPERAWLAVELHRGADDAAELTALRALGTRHGLPLVAAGDVHMHVRRRRALQDVMTAIRLGSSVAAAGHALFPNGERHLRKLEDLAALYPPELLAESVRVAEQCRFSLDDLAYEYPHELVPSAISAIEHLRRLTYAGAAAHWPGGVPEAVQAQIEKELALIEYKRFEHFFLTVEDIVRWARAQSPPILCQGRGSSANSAVCFCLGITAVNPATGNLLFERFLSKERDEPPDIDVDFEHERREEVLQYVFAKYGRGRAALAATVISYRRKSAVRDIGRALGLPQDTVEQLSGIFSRVASGLPLEAELRARGFDPSSRVLVQLFKLAAELRGFPRHLSQHVGGFVISEKPLHHLVPVENAAMPDRTIIQWDKDDLETMKLLKVDCLALGMLTCIRKCVDLLHEHGLWDLPYTGARPSLKDIPQHDDPAVYDMICAADTVGVFQIESRAQMSMLPRLRPRQFYDLVIEVAIVRPGPIQGDMVHPYLRRRKNLEPVDYPQSKFERATGTDVSRVREALARTLGVPIFQEQVMKLIQIVAGFSAGEADELRRAMAAWKRKGGLEKFRDRIRDGMLERGYDEAYFERIFQQIKGFGEYGFPESHAASFALLAWGSSWLKHYHPAAFACALLNSQPMGFYQASQLIQDAQRHGVHVRPVDVCISAWDCTLELDATADAAPSPQPSPPMREPSGERESPVHASAQKPSPPMQEPSGERESHVHASAQKSFPLLQEPSGERESPVHASAQKPSPPNAFGGEGRVRGRRENASARPVLRLGLRQIKGVSEDLARRLGIARSERPFADVADMTRRARVSAAERALLADAGALRSLSAHRYRARWESAGAELPLPVLAAAAVREQAVSLRTPSLREDVMSDYATQGLSLTLHPLALIRPELTRRRVIPARRATQSGLDGRRLRCAGLVTVRQQPGTANGVIFVTLEDETGQVNVVVWRKIAERQHRVLLESAVMAVDGKVQISDGVHHLVAERLHDYTPLLPDIGFVSRDFH